MPDLFFRKATGNLLLSCFIEIIDTSLGTLDEIDDNKEVSQPLTQM